MRNSHNYVEIKKSSVGQFPDGLGVFALRDIRKGEELFIQEYIEEDF